jgi:hypothetical protein
MDQYTPLVDKLNSTNQAALKWEIRDSNIIVFEQFSTQHWSECTNGLSTDVGNDTHP